MNEDEMEHDWRWKTYQLLSWKSPTDLINGILEIVELKSQAQHTDKDKIDFFKDKTPFQESQEHYVSSIKKVINSKLKIIDVAKGYGIQVDGKKMNCIYHDDEDPSMVLYDKTNTFFCFGCRKSGDIIEFIRRMEEGFKAIKTLTE